MSARITVKAELASLLAKAQATTDANRAAQRRAEADRTGDRQRLAAKAAKQSAAAKKPQPEPVGRNIFTAAMGQKGYPFAFGFAAFKTIPAWPNIVQGTTVWSGDGAVSVDNEQLEINGSSQITVPTGGETSITTNTQSFRQLDLIYLPINGNEFIYCYFGNRRIGSSVWTQVTTVDGTFVDNGGTSVEESFCAIVGKTAARVLTMPTAVSDAMRAAAGDVPWLPGDRLTSNGGLSYFPRWGRFRVETSGSFSQIALSNSRFEGMGISAGIYQAMGLPPSTPPNIKLLGYDLTRNPDAPIPVYVPNPYYRSTVNQIVIPPPRTLSQLIRSWDWGRPGYCRAQLLALGFTAEDLSPTLPTP